MTAAVRYRPVVGRIAVVLVTAAVISGASCAPKLNARQELTYEAYYACRGEGPSTLLQRVNENGDWYVEGREMEVFRVSSCMSRYVHDAAQKGRVR